MLTNDSEDSNRNNNNSKAESRMGRITIEMAPSPAQEPGPMTPIIDLILKSLPTVSSATKQMHLSSAALNVLSHSL